MREEVVEERKRELAPGYSADVDEESVLTDTVVAMASRAEGVDLYGSLSWEFVSWLNSARFLCDGFNYKAIGKHPVLLHHITKELMTDFKVLSPGEYVDGHA